MPYTEIIARVTGEIADADRAESELQQGIDRLVIDTIPISDADVERSRVHTVDNAAETRSDAEPRQGILVRRREPA